MNIGEKLKNLRYQKNLTQEELGERTDLSKGYISQLERNLSSPSMETFLNILDVLGVEPSEFFNEKLYQARIHYPIEEQTLYDEYDEGYIINWLVPDSNELEMEPVVITLRKGCKYKSFAPSSSETFAYVKKGSITLNIGKDTYTAKEGECFYFKANESHQFSNQTNQDAEVLIVATESYL
ncbi:helix-turn-helix domain-containing protein [Mammaliicoccus stepanovicii]|uniref:Putative DNA-binding protein n=1 Tax=Mammaliicoccus stepanovicii TaxID=643214 RepID=A0A239ZP81_9STAP|nr:XRE family transcriptional regulator [Mammaliicoccus stepanovicii]PNZ79189.1 Cro/Cl family transcriptional regulator [Mammaliicoccus stepanovicii]GGI41449.1 Cro/Cl family transcriptional regulator [Mammaliicoccus stepanovicii]SNV72603.1 putative DNA-binding protein [Mammaliicoccus stepanovicii]